MEATSAGLEMAVAAFVAAVSSTRVPHDADVRAASMSTMEIGVASVSLRRVVRQHFMVPPDRMVRTVALGQNSVITRTFS